MANENGANGAAGPVETSGGEAAVNALFGGAGAPEGASKEAQQSAEGTWHDGYIPKMWRDETGAFNGDTNGVLKSWYHGQQQVSKLQTDLDSLRAERSAAEAAMPNTTEYVDDFDYDALADRAPNMIAKGGGKEENTILASFLTLAHKHGVPMAKAHALAGDYFEALNADVPEYKEPEQQRKEAVAHLGPNGAQMVEDVRGFLAQRARTSPFNAEQMDVIKGMLHNGPALALLHNLSRTTGASTTPPSVARISQVDMEQERREALKALGSLDGEEWARNKDAILARVRRAHPEWEEG